MSRQVGGKQAILWASLREKIGGKLNGVWENFILIRFGCGEKGGVVVRLLGGLRERAGNRENRKCNQGQGGGRLLITQSFFCMYEKQ